MKATERPTDLIEAAKAASKKAHAPYSNFHVGCAIRGKSGKIYVGCNVENASYGGTVCAERNCVAAAIVAGEKELLECVVFTPTDEPATPCGFCRQVLLEFAPSMPVFCVAKRGKMLKSTVGELLPHAFSSERLNITPWHASKSSVSRS